MVAYVESPTLTLNREKRTGLQPVGLCPDGQRKEYWKRPEVWTDLKAGFDKFCELCPDANGTRQRCALYAYKCGQWEELNKQLSLLKSVDYDYSVGERNSRK